MRLTLTSKILIGMAMPMALAIILIMATAVMAAPKVGSIAITTSQYPSPVSPGYNCTYGIVVYRGSGPGVFTANITVTDLPDGATSQPANVTFSSKDVSVYTNLTIQTLASTPAGTHNITIIARNINDPADFASVNGTLVIGNINVSSNIAEATFTLTGAASYSGTTPWSVNDAPIGDYTIVWDDKTGYTTPPGETKTLTDGGSITFDGVYVVIPPGVGTINVSSNVAEATFTLTGAASYSGTTPWSVNDAPIGDYTIVWDDKTGYTTPPGETKTLTDGGTIDFFGEYKEIPKVGTMTCDVTAGSDVTVALGNVSVSFQTVTAGGSVTITVLTDNPAGAFPANFEIVGLFVDITTTATYNGPVSLAIKYDESGISSEKDLRLLHWNGSIWEDVTTAVDTEDNLIYGEVTMLSPFVIGQSVAAVPSTISSETGLPLKAWLAIGACGGFTIVAIVYVVWRRPTASR